MDFLKDFDFETLKYDYYLDTYRMIIKIKVDKNNILEDIVVLIKDGYKKICNVNINNFDYKYTKGTFFGYGWGMYCKTKLPGSGLIDLILWIALYIFRKYQLRELVNPNHLYTQEVATKDHNYIVIYNLIKKSKKYEKLDFEELVHSLNNENLWYNEKFNFKFKCKKKLIKWFLNLNHVDIVDYDTLYQDHEENFLEKYGEWKPLSLRKLKQNIEITENNLNFDYI